MRDNITAIYDSNFYGNNVSRVGGKIVKLSTFVNASKNTADLMAAVIPQQAETKAENVESSVVPEVQAIDVNQVAATGEVDNNPTEKQAEETPLVDENIIPLPSKETLEARCKALNVVTYNDLVGNITLEANRKLRVNILVMNILNHARKVIALDPIISQGITNEAESSITIEDEMLDDNLETEIQDTNDEDNLYNNNVESNSDNVVKLDEWLNKETSTIKSTADKILDEVTALQAKVNDSADSLATQKEILAKLRERIANNEVLCQQRKRQLEEENMALTQELNSVLAEINQLTDQAYQQEAFLGIKDEELIGGKSRAA